jgi:hypothetical protein
MMLVGVLAAALVIAGVGAFSWAQTEADQTAPTAVTSQEGDSEGDGRGEAQGRANGNRGENGQGRDIEPVACDEARTHGEYVSSVARSTPGGPGKGAVVSEAARSDCGKPDETEVDGDD